MDEGLVHQLEEAFFNDGYKLAKSSLDKGISTKSLCKLSENLYEYLDQFLDTFYRLCIDANSPIACYKGCVYCCSNAVFILPFEAICIVNYMHDNFQSNNIELLKERNSKKNESTKKMRIKEVLHYKHPCPLLVNNTCGVYRVRPVACRIYLSMDVQSCIDELENPYDFSVYPTLYKIPLHLGRMLNEGVCNALREFQIRPIEWGLEFYLDQFLTDEKSIEKWLNGAELFNYNNYSEEEWEYLKNYSQKHT